MSCTVSFSLYLCTHPFPRHWVFSLYPDPSLKTRSCLLHLVRSFLPILHALTVGASRSGHRRQSSGQIDTHIIAYQYLLSMRAEMIGNWSCFDSPPPPSASGSRVWLQRASVELHKSVWKYLSIHNSHMESEVIWCNTPLRLLQGNKC